jgi:excisionase family DNA binding protein
MEKQTVNTKEVAKILNIGLEQARSLVHGGKLPNVGSEKRIRIPKVALERFLEGK